MPQRLQRVFLLAVLAGTTYVSWTLPWKAVTRAGAARLPLCSRASRCHPLRPPPSPAATASAKNDEPPSGAAQTVPVPQSCSAPCVFPVDLRISAMLFINCSIINQTRSLAALNEQPVSSAPTATSPLPSQLPWLYRTPQHWSLHSVAPHNSSQGGFSNDLISPGEQALILPDWQEERN